MNTKLGGAAFVWPLIQDYQYLDLTPMPIEINLQGALSRQNTRVNTPSTFTVGVSTEPGIMGNAAERLLGMDMAQIQELARDIIFGQMRVVIATMTIEEINADREKLIENIFNGVEVELNKVGLHLINVNIQDITDESGYIDALGKEAAARAVNEAKVQVAERERDGEIGRAEAEREQRIEVSAIVFATEADNMRWGMNVDAWVQEGLVDTIVAYPYGTRGYSKAEAWTEPVPQLQYHRDVVEGTECRLAANLYPRGMAPEAYRRRAAEIYATGIDRLFIWDCTNASGHDSFTALRRLGHADELKHWIGAGSPSLGSDQARLRKLGDWDFTYTTPG